MRFNTNKKHMIDLLFPVTLLFVFAVSSLTVILLAANIYQTVTKSASLHYSARTSLAYVSEKIHQNDAGGAVSLGTFDGTDALILQQTIDGNAYYTYIYEYENNLMELFVKDGVEASLSAGHIILPTADFTMEELKDGLFRFSCTDADGQSAATIVGVKSSSIEME